MKKHFHRLKAGFYICKAMGEFSPQHAHNEAKKIEAILILPGEFSGPIYATESGTIYTKEGALGCTPSCRLKVVKTKADFFTPEIIRKAQYIKF